MIMWVVGLFTLWGFIIGYIIGYGEGFQYAEKFLGRKR